MLDLTIVMSNFFEILLLDKTYGVRVFQFACHFTRSSIVGAAWACLSSLSFTQDGTTSTY